MFNFASNSTKNLRFRRWSRKSYAVFASLNKVVSIGSLVVSVADKSLLKTASHISNFVSDLLMDSQEVSDSAFDELETATNNCILQTLSIRQRTDAAAAGAIGIYASKRATYKGESPRMIALFLSQKTTKKSTNSIELNFKHMKNKQLLLVFLFTFSVLQLQASDSLRVELNTLQVTAPIQKIYSELGRIVHSIDKKQIQAMPVSSIDQLLETITGVDIRNRGVGGTQADISIRGGSFDQVLVLLNGVNITDPQTGHHNLNVPLDLADVERIELLQGTSARLLGPNAFSGALNIVTASKTGNKVNAHLTAGSFETLSQSVSASVGTEKLSLFATASRNTSEGYRDNTDYKTTNAFAHAQYRTKKAGEFGLQLAAQDKGFGANSFYSLAYPNQFEHTETQFAAFDWNLQLNALKLSAQAYNRTHYDRFELYRNNENAADWYKGHNYHLTNINGAKILGSVNTNIGKFALTFEQRREHILSTVLGTALTTPVENSREDNIFFTKEKTRNISNAAFDYSLFLNQFYVSAGAALSHSNDFGLQPTWGIDLGYELSKYARLFAAANSAVRLPTFTDLFYNGPTFLGNPELQPEKSTSIELGAKYQKNRFKADATVFYNIGRDIIDWIMPVGSTQSQSQNLTSLNTKGIELSANYSPKSTIFQNLSFTYAFIDQDKEATGYDSRYALDYLRHKMTASLKHKVHKHINASWQASYNDRNGTYTNLSKQIVDYKPFALLNLRIEAPSKQYTVYVDANNISDTKFVDFGGLTQPGFNLLAGIRFHLTTF